MATSFKFILIRFSFSSNLKVIGLEHCFIKTSIKELFFTILLPLHKFISLSIKDLLACFIKATQPSIALVVTYLYIENITIFTRRVIFLTFFTMPLIRSHFCNLFATIWYWTSGISKCCVSFYHNNGATSRKIGW